jgi:glycosyltransferase involved in cell wall biosynthesis
LVALIYFAFQVSLTLSWHKLDFHLFWKGEFPLVSVVIAARNEAEHLDATVTSILTQKYPEDQYEIILVDNHSTDETLSIMQSKALNDQRIKVIDLAKQLPVEKAFKKHALSAGIELARGEIILTTDADCVTTDEWIYRMVGYVLESGKDLITGPVKIEETDLLIEKYQQLELAGLAVVTGGGIKSRSLLMANGANLAFKRQSFLNHHGYSEMPSVTSGDDVFLLQKLYLADPSSVGFFKDSRAAVTTKGSQDLRSFLQQRKRWSSKARLYQHIPTKILAILVALNSSMIVLHLILSIIWGYPFCLILVAHFLIKVIADTFLLAAGIRFFQLSVKPSILVFSHLINPLIAIAITAMTIVSRTYQWKDRRTI